MLSTPARIIFTIGILLGISISALELAKFYAEQLEYQPFVKISSILLILLIVYALYWGLKEIKNRFLKGNIKFTRAFIYGCGISFVAFMVVFFYLILHYHYIDVEGLQRINEKNTTLQPLTNILPASLYFSFSVFLYGIFLNLFVSMYVYKNRE